MLEYWKATHLEHGIDIYNNWDDFDEWYKMTICSNFWYGVTRTGIINTGYISHGAAEILALKKKPTPDHFVSPRTALRGIMEYNRELLKDDDAFDKTYFNLRHIIKVTSAENENARYTNKDGHLTIHALTIEKYKKLRWIGPHGNSIKKGTFPLVDMVPDYVTEFEKKHFNEVI